MHPPLSAGTGPTNRGQPPSLPEEPCPVRSTTGVSRQEELVVLVDVLTLAALLLVGLIITGLSYAFFTMIGGGGSISHLAIA